MKRKEIDLNSTLYEVTRDHPELIELLIKVGFSGAGSAAARNTVGRTMTLAAGAGRLGVDLEKLERCLQQEGFAVLS